MALITKAALQFDMFQTVSGTSYLKRKVIEKNGGNYEKEAQLFLSGILGICVCIYFGRLL